MNIMQEIEQLRVVLPCNPVVPTKSREQRAIELYADHSLREVGAIIGIGFEAVRRILIRHGVQLRPAHKNIHSQKGKKRGPYGPRPNITNQSTDSFPRYTHYPQIDTPPIESANY